MVAYLRKASCKRLNSLWRGKAEGINTLVVITSYKSLGSARNQTVYKLKVGWVEILILINNEVSNTQEPGRVKRACRHVIDTLANDFAGKNTRIYLCSGFVEFLVVLAFSVCNWWVRRYIVWR